MSGFDDRVRAVLDAVDAEGSLCAREVGGEREVGLAPDEPVVLASVFKVPVLVELYRRISAGELDARQRVRTNAAQRSPGPTGLSPMLDDVELSLRDLALSMMSVSDNAATDVVMELVGSDRIDKTMRELGLGSITVAQTCRDIYGVLAADMGATSPDEVEAAFEDPATKAAVLERVRGSAVLDPARTNAGTPSDVARLFELIWTDAAAPAAACAEMRRILGLQVWPHRLRAGFPDEVSVAGKTGTLPFVRNEAGVVVDPDGRRYTVAVFLRPRSGDLVLPDVDRAIGTLGRLAVDELRGAGRG